MSETDDQPQISSNEAKNCSDALFEDFFKTALAKSPDNKMHNTSDEPQSSIEDDSNSSRSQSSIKKERFVDPLIKPIDDALCEGKKEEALKEAESILAKTGEKNGKHSTEYLYSLYKVALTLQPAAANAVSPAPPYAEQPEAAAKYWQELIDKSNSLYKKEADFMPMVGDAYMGLGLALAPADKQFIKNEVRCYEQAEKIYNNILNRVGPEQVGIKRLTQLNHCYNNLQVGYRNLGEMNKLSQTEKKLSNLAKIINKEYYRLSK